jgi:hypothetical protein
MTGEIDFMSDDICRWIYGILIHETRADPDEVAFMMFRDYLQSPRYPKEYRFMGWLGIGGKFYASRSKWWVSCYPEDSNEEREEMISRANTKLADLRTAFMESRRA